MAFSRSPSVLLRFVNLLKVPLYQIYFFFIFQQVKIVRQSHTSII